MSWRVEFRPEVEEDAAEAAAWYEARQPGLGGPRSWRNSFSSGMRLRKIPSPPEKGYTLALSRTVPLARRV